MGFARHSFCSGSRQEVNITWYSEIEEPIKSREKHYSLVSYILMAYITNRPFRFLYHVLPVQASMPFAQAS